MRFRNQGTLFAPDRGRGGLSSSPGSRERDPSLPDSTADGADERRPADPGDLPPLVHLRGLRRGLQAASPAAPGRSTCGSRTASSSGSAWPRAPSPTGRTSCSIDEINRGNIPKIFGELITLLELDKRGPDGRRCPRAARRSACRRTCIVIGTMNTADRSIRLLDAALRRRFAFIELMPDPSLLEGGRVAGLDLAAFLAELNRRIAERDGREKQIGHSFLLDGDQPVDRPGAVRGAVPVRDPAAPPGVRVRGLSRARRTTSARRSDRRRRAAARRGQARRPAGADQRARRGVHAVGADVDASEG